MKKTKKFFPVFPLGSVPTKVHNPYQSNSNASRWYLGHTSAHHCEHFSRHPTDMCICTHNISHAIIIIVKFTTNPGSDIHPKFKTPEAATNTKPKTGILFSCGRTKQQLSKLVSHSNHAKFLLTHSDLEITVS